MLFSKRPTWFLANFKRFPLLPGPVTEGKKCRPPGEARKKSNVNWRDCLAASLSALRTNLSEARHATPTNIVSLLSMCPGPAHSRRRVSDTDFLKPNPLEMRALPFHRQNENQSPAQAVHLPGNLIFQYPDWCQGWWVLEQIVTAG
jgi:hypothetical protein